MKLLKKLCFTAMLFFPAYGIAWSQQMVSVNVSVPSISFNQAPYVIAREKGYFRQEGITPTLILMHSAVASKALVSKDVEFNASGSPAINTALAGFPVRAVFANGDRTDMYLIGAKGIQSPEQLKGKKVATGGIGGLADVGARKFL